jgi:hypothetical protein
MWCLTIDAITLVNHGKPQVSLHPSLQQYKQQESCQVFDEILDNIHAIAKKQ